MSQPFDKLDWDVRRIRELEAEIERREVEHEGFLLKAEREKSVLLEALKEALEMIERLKKR